MMKRISSIGRRLFPLFFLLAASAAQGENLLPNPAFNTDLSSWNNLGGITSSWNHEDANGSGSSGSAQIVYPSDVHASSDGIFSPCLTVGAGTHYSFGAKFKIPSGQTTQPGAFASLAWYSNANCTGFLSAANTANVTATDSWVSASVADTVAPAGATSAYLYLYASQVDPGTTTVLADDAFINGPPTDCTVNDNTLCLNGGRFIVTTRWQTSADPADSGQGHAVPLTGDTGYFWFFSSNNVEVIVKVVGACVDPFNRYWVFASGLTNVEVTLTVIDTQTHLTNRYHSPNGTAFAAIQDTDAFATCP